MDNRPIGVFDSGIGGLTVLYELVKFFPSEDFVYLGDNACVPYGEKSDEEVFNLASGNVDKLFSLGVKAVVIACNTASALLRKKINKNGLFFMGTDNDDLKKYKGDGAFFGTPVTVKNILKNADKETLNKVDFYSLDGLSACIENNPFTADGKSVIVEALQRSNVKKDSEKKSTEIGERFDSVDFTNSKLHEEFFSENGVFRVPADHRIFEFKKYDFLYLGCTHYLFLKDIFKGLFGVETAYDGIRKTTQILNNYLEKCGLFGNNVQTVNFVGEWANKNASVFARYVERNS